MNLVGNKELINHYFFFCFMMAFFFPHLFWVQQITINLFFFWALFIYNFFFRSIIKFMCDAKTHHLFIQIECYQKTKKQKLFNEIHTATFQTIQWRLILMQKKKNTRWEKKNSQGMKLAIKKIQQHFVGHLSVIHFSLNAFNQSIECHFSPFI